MDLKKEIKLSDLKPKRKAKPALATSSLGTSHKAKARGKGKVHDLVGLKVGASQLAAAHVVNNGTAKLVQVEREPLDPGVVVAGEVRDIAALGRALDAFFERHSLPRKNVRLGIGTNRVGVRTLDIDGITDERQLTNAVMFRAHEALSIPMEQAVLDFHVVGSGVKEGGDRTHRVVLAAAYREPVDHLVLACRAANIQLVGVDVEAFALLRALGTGRPAAGDEKTALIALALGYDRSTLAVSDGAVCDFTRVLDWGGSKLDTAIGRELGLSPEDAQELKLAVSLQDDADGDPRHAAARAAMRSELVTLARELVASLQFYQSQPGSHPIAEILVTGGTTRIPGLAEELERLIRARVRVADPLGAVEVGTPDITAREDLASLTVAIGLGVEL